MYLTFFFSARLHLELFYKQLKTVIWREKATWDFGSTLEKVVNHFSYDLKTFLPTFSVGLPNKPKEMWSIA